MHVHQFWWACLSSFGDTATLKNGHFLLDDNSIHSSERILHLKKIIRIIMIIISLKCISDLLQKFMEAIVYFLVYSPIRCAFTCMKFGPLD